MNKQTNIEKSIYIHRLSLLSGIKKIDFSRLYFGEDFCPFRLPSEVELKKILDFVDKKNLKFTLVTPWLTDDVLYSVRSLIKLLPKKSEVVINDYALLPEKKEDINFIPVLGRLLNGQMRGLRKDHKRRLSKNVIDHFKNCQPQTKWSAEFYKEKGIKRVELDNLIQGLKTDFKKFGFSGSLYYPNVFITVTRFCPCLIKKDRLSSVFFSKECSRRCEKDLYYLKNEEIEDKVFIRGNYHFYKNPHVPKNLSKLGINRLVKEIL